ncbi:MAG: PilZ domain-containing protein [Deltaproteobacteria bacterium]|nr:PilZ domain-containing protein [Deltaproteobacteria bacterium]MDQ3298789.1 PilZ domain-containing protein [Myxococcota bacterium]
MHPRLFPPLIEAYLIIDQPRQRLSHWTKSIAPLDDHRAPALSSVTAYYDPTTDQALLGLRYDEVATGADGLAFVVEIALLAELGMIQPAELGTTDRRRVLDDRLARCTLQVADQRSVVGALTDLVRKVREHRQVKPAPIAAMRGSGPRAAPAARASLTPRGTEDDPVLLVQPKSTRDDLEQAADTRVVTPPAPPPTPWVHRAQTVQADPTELQQLAAEAVARDSGRDSGRDAGRDAASEAVTGDGVVMRADSGPSSPMSSPSSASLRIARPRSQSGTERYLPTANGPTPPGIIHARYLRSGRWVPIRIGALSLKGAALMAGALPRLHDHVDIALSFGDQRALVRGPVSKVATMQEAALSGAATFSMHFDLDDASRRQLTSLLTAARAANVTIKPPPPRVSRRYPVEWPVHLNTTRGPVRADALDVSLDGMFVRPKNPLVPETHVTFSTLIDDGAGPVSGRAKIVRTITEVEARACGLAVGYGLHIYEMGDDDRVRWESFIRRVEKRSEKRVLIGAAPARLAELQAALAAAGYAVTGGTDAGALVQLASTEARPVDAAMIDYGWLTPGTPVQWVESLFAARNVPCATIHGDARRARMMIDKILSVV